MEGKSGDVGLVQRFVTVAKSDPIGAGAFIIVFIGWAVYEPSSALSTIVGVSLMAATFHLYNTWTRKKASTTESSKTATSSKSSAAAAAGKHKNANRLKNIWDAGTSDGNNGSAKKTTHEEKPFGSKYYYAHNNPNATGGYKDGLRMEDFRMNGPRLLSKDGLPAAEDTPPSTTSDPEDAAPGNTTTAEPKTTTKRITAHDPTVQNITKYLWDDPGDWNGIATIRIDTLPEKNGQATINWTEVKVVNVKADLVGEGLLVKVETADRGKYQLKIAKLYGDAAEVKTVVKPKRLLVKIYKKKNAVLAKRVNTTSNLDAWPQPHRKI